VGTFTAVSVNQILQTDEIFLGVVIILNNYLYWFNLRLCKFRHFWQALKRTWNIILNTSCSNIKSVIQI